ncbi:hypothetical protein GCM10025883_16540 [Mobilicoccus caccae]|uniref:Uncharacterized protein n=1 Tax=Mobilicoccus caccae TaxID=1859295 RepID=A0ABQ6INY7_9MICO|nr:hypothetical protein GCM10025883_16540 [Mobilicoccus caccae]
MSEYGAQTQPAALPLSTAPTARIQGDGASATVVAPTTPHTPPPWWALEARAALTVVARTPTR